MIKSTEAALYLESLASCFDSLQRKEHSKVTFELAHLLLKSKFSDEEQFLSLIVDLEKFGKPNKFGQNLRSDDFANALMSFAKLSSDLENAHFANFVNKLATNIKHADHMFMKDLIASLSKRVADTSPTLSPAELSSVEDYTKALMERIHDPKMFPIVFEKLKTDRNMTKDKVVKVANKVAFPMSKSTTKKLALERIWDQHETSRTVGAKIESQRGLSAA